jgi:hypothetical protein
MQKPCLVFVLAALSSVAAFAQTATVLGTVTDPSGAVVPTATITITNTATSAKRVIQTNSTGNYVAPELPIGPYAVTAESPGFKRYERTNLKLDSNDVVRVDAVLQVGQISESVTVAAEAVKVESDSSEVSDLISGKQVEELAINGRHMAGLAILTPGASSDLPDFNLPVSVNGSTNISFNGQREEHNVWMIDGGENYDRGCGGCVTMMPAVSAIAEFNTITSNGASDIGIGSGGNINMAIKSGTRDFHGEIYEYFRNDAMDANNYFSNLAGQPVSELRYNIYGWNIGGPVFIPKLYNTERKKTFFFWNQEWRKFVIGTPIPLSNAVPQAQRNGDFSALSTPIKVPVTTNAAQNAAFASLGLTPGSAFPGNKIPSSLIDPNAALFFASGAMPLPNAPNNQYTTAKGVPTDVPETLLRFDHYFSDKLSLMGHYIHDNTDQQVATSLWSGDTYPTIGTNFKNPSWGGVVHLTYSISPTLLNEVAFNLNGNWIDLTPIGIYQKPAGWTATSLFDHNALNRLPTIGLGGSYGVNYDPASWPWGNAAWDKQVRDDVSWTKGAHSMKFGGQFMRYSKNQDIFGDTQGNYNFDGSFTGNAVADMLLGYAKNYSQLDLEDSTHTRTTTASFYFTDNWRLNKRLTLNLGARWEIIPHAYDVQNRLSNFYPNLYNPSNAGILNSATGAFAANSPGFTTVPNVPLGNIPFYLNGVVIAGQDGTPRGMVKNDYGTVGPRVGFAYDLTGKGKTIVRGGFGMFFERVQGNDVYNMGPNPPFGYNASLSSVSFSNPNVSILTGQAAAVPNYPATITALAYSNYQPPTSAQWNFGIQHQVSDRSVLSVAYVGNADYHQRDEREINALALNDPNRAGVISGYNANLDRPYLGYSNIVLGESASNTHYESLQVNYRIDNWQGFTFQTSYTWAHSLGIAPGGGGDFNTLSDPYNRYYDYGPTGLDRRQVLVLNYIYALPFFKDNKGFAGSALGGWTLSGITLCQTGLPLNVTMSSDYLGLGGNATDRPNIVGPISYPGTAANWFNTAAFQAPIPTTFGDAQEGAVRGPGRVNFNLQLYKNFRLPKERAGLKFGAEFYNTFNHTQFHDVNTSAGSSAFGQVVDTYDPRVIELSLKLSF